MRDYLHPNEITKLLAAAKASPRYGQRNHLLVLLAVCQREPNNPQL